MENVSAPQTAKLVALWIMHGLACARLLREHGRGEHALNFETALEELKEIMASEVGRDELSRAIEWASAELWEDEVAAGCGCSQLRH